MRICTTILLIVINITQAYSQADKELDLLKGNCCTEHKSSQVKLSDSDGSLVSTLFVFYKVFLSSQDHQSCVFTPSCSEYAVQSIKEQGLIMGALDTFDRLSRCHGLRPHDYPMEPHSKLFIDPVRNVRYETP